MSLLFEIELSMLTLHNTRLYFQLLANFYKESTKKQIYLFLQCLFMYMIHFYHFTYRILVQKLNLQCIYNSWCNVIFQEEFFIYSANPWLNDPGLVQAYQGLTKIPVHNLALSWRYLHNLAVLALSAQSSYLDAICTIKLSWRYLHNLAILALSSQSSYPGAIFTI